MSSRRFVVLTPFGQPDIVAGILRLRGLDARVIATNSGVCVVHDVAVPAFTDWDIAELLGGEPEPAQGEPANPADDPDNLAGPLSALSEFGVVLLTAELGDDVGSEAGLSGMVTGVRYLGGLRGEEVQAGILLNTLDPKVESLVINGAAGEGISSMDLSLADVERILGGAPKIDAADDSDGVPDDSDGEGVR